MKISREVKIGIMVIAGLAALFFGFNYLKGVNIFVPSNSFYATYARIDGLEKSAPVTIKGFKIGQVSDIQYDFTKKKPFVVVVSLNSNVKIPTGSTFVLGSDGLMSKGIQIDLNTASNTFYAAGDTVTSTISGGMLDIAEQEIVPAINKMIPQIDSLLRVVRALAEHQALQNTLQSLEVTANNAEKISGKFNNMMQTDIPIIVKDFNTMSANLAEMTESLNKADLAGTLSTVDNLVQDLNLMTQKINNAEGSIGLLLNDKSFYENLSNTMYNADQLMIDLKERPSRYVHFSIFGRSDKKDNKK